VSRGTWDTTRVLQVFAYEAITLYGQAFQPVQLTIRIPHCGPATPYLPKQLRFRLFPFRSPLLRESLLLSFPEGTKMFQFPSFASMAYVFSHRCPDINRSGLPHSETPGSKPV
jgi:hypothetical protein